MCVGLHTEYHHKPNQKYTKPQTTYIYVQLSIRFNGVKLFVNATYINIPVQQQIHFVGCHFYRLTDVQFHETLSNTRFTNKIFTGGSLSEGYVDQYLLLVL